MKTQQPDAFTNNFLSLILIVFVLGILSPGSAAAQIDFFYGKNNKGLRIGAGIAGATLRTNFNSNPTQIAYVGSLDYDFNPYLSVGLEGQYGKLVGVDDVHHLLYSSSTDQYASGTANIRVGLGEIKNFNSKNRFQDAVKRIYIGVGAGVIHVNITSLPKDNNSASKIQSGPVLYGNYLVIPFNIGTNIDLLKVLGYDKLSLTPNFQYSYVSSMYLDGLQTTAEEKPGYYNLVSLKLKYKFGK